MGEIRRFAGGGIYLPPARPVAEGAPERSTVKTRLPTGLSSYPEVFVTVDEPVVFRDFRVARVSIHPVHYAAEAKRCKSFLRSPFVYGMEGETESNPKTGVRRPIPPSLVQCTGNSLINYESV